MYSFEYQIGGNENWVVPPAIDTRIYVDWALENRFQVGDTARDQFKHKEIRGLPLPSTSWVFIIFFCEGFKHRKDSVMKVRVEDYKKCNSRHPNFFSNTVHHLNHPASASLSVPGKCSYLSLFHSNKIPPLKHRSRSGSSSIVSQPSELGMVMRLSDRFL
ncbi:hypothetical protein POTOM_059860 [Populus tomentosa]|uniref:Uncharacterized protein n=1 Tax=Populus tomentosa TaxID=118781 RepID=A0A8X7XSN9_POPTO|nr:hypothetical protein POTOM_059860 [Populus tomentosa]